jgi:hypothetical protein
VPWFLLLALVMKRERLRLMGKSIFTSISIEQIEVSFVHPQAVFLGEMKVLG